MPVVDFPIDQLKAYQGSTPKPDDFDLYWDRALKELKEIAPLPLLKKSEFQVSFAECFDLYFTSAGGARIHAKYLRPKGAAHCPVIFMFHGYLCSSGEWYDKLPYAAAGFAVAVLDCRGQGGESQDTNVAEGSTVFGHVIRGVQDPDPDKMLYRNIFLDTARLVDVVAGFPETDADRLCACGGSQGGALALVCAALSQHICRLSVCYPFLSDYKRVWDMDMDKVAYADISEYFRRFDPLHETEEWFFKKMGYIDVQNFAPRIRAKTMFAISQVDDICPASTQFAVFNKLTCEKTLLLYPDYGHEPLPGHNDLEFAFMTKF